ncbi:MAG: RNA ligase family protein [Myxococcota bacterium]
MTDFIKFPHTPHLAWLGAGTPRDDKVLDAAERDRFLSHDLVIEEKVDGANLGISVSVDGEVRAQNRGEYLRPDVGGQFERLWPWLKAREDALFDALGQGLVLYGEWCLARHSVAYASLPDWFLAFDVWDKQAGRFWSTPRRNELTRRLGLATVPEVARGRFDLPGLRALLGPSRLGAPSLEGVYLRVEDGDFLIDRAKLVRPEFVQAIGEHWSRGVLRRNEVIRSGLG